ncbi:MAG: Ca-activated chloride channel [Verrucomicrobiota bacterium]|jgi:Ca-activated chloride channel family protein
MIEFGAPNWFWGLVLIPLLGFLFVRAEKRAASRLRAFVSERLLPNLARTVDRRRRAFRFALTLLGVGLAIVTLAKPRWGYTYQDVKRKGLDLIFAVDTSRSMLSNDVAPSRLQRVKLAAQDLLSELQGDRVGLVAFAGRAFLQAPLTIDYDAAVEAINDLDTNTIPEGGTNISAAIDLAVQTYGKSAIGNRALIIFTDGEELNGDAMKTAKAAADAGVRVFTVGVGTPEGSLIPISGEGGGTGFVKDSNGQVVKSKLDEKRLKEIAESTGGFYIHLEDGPRTMKQLSDEGLTKMQAGEIDERLSRRPIERYQWPLGTALLVLSAGFLLRERRREPARAARPLPETRQALAAAAILVALASSSFGAAPGLDAYRNDNYTEAYQQFEKTLQEHPNTHARDRIEFDAGTAAYKLGDYNKALEWFSQSLLSKDKSLQEKSHYNIGRTLEERADKAETIEKALGELQNAQSHYEEALRLDPNDERAKANLEEVKKKIERLKQNPKKQPTPPPQSQKDKKQDKKDQQQKQDQQQKNDQDQQQEQQKSGENDQKQQQQAKNDKKQSPPNADESPSPSPGDNKEQKQNERGSSPSPSPDKGNGADKKENKQQSENGEPDASPSASPSPSEDASPSPSPGSGDQPQPEGSPSASPGASPGKEKSGKVEAAGDEKPKEPPKNAQAVEAEPEKEGQMSEKQAQMLLQSMKDEEQRVQLDERKAARHVYKDW